MINRNTEHSTSQSPTKNNRRYLSRSIPRKNQVINGEYHVPDDFAKMGLHTDYYKTNTTNDSKFELRSTSTKLQLKQRTICLEPKYEEQTDLIFARFSNTYSKDTHRN
jgi:hypothetical protein